MVRSYKIPSVDPSAVSVTSVTKLPPGHTAMLSANCLSSWADSLSSCCARTICVWTIVRWTVSHSSRHGADEIWAFKYQHSWRTPVVYTAGICQL